MPQLLPRVLTCLLLALLLVGSGYAQVRPTVPSSRRCVWVRVPAGRDTAEFTISDTLTVVPSSVSVEGRAVAFDPRTERYRLTGAAGQPDSVLVCYRVLPLRLSAPLVRRPRSLMDSVSFYNRPTFGYGDFAQQEQILATPGLNKTGNLTRGISFGNAQNVFVNSALNLQLEGKLTDQINLTANISDQNVPFQPEGNTQQLQEFDRIYITLTHPNWALTAGDVVLRNKPDYFLRFYKNIQGAALEANFQQRPGWRSSTTVAGGVAKGKFASITLTPIENVQGPYRLRGPNGEQFIIALANSERVYLDGNLLVRGFDNDYIIDYNTAEITFSPRHLITSNSRLRVDFEYSDFNYARSLYHLSHYQEAGRVSVHANYYREADNPDNSPNLTLSETDKEILRNLPGNISQASVPGAEKAEKYDRKLIQYNQRVVTDPATGTQTTVYTFPPDSTIAVYNVRFTDVGQGNGDYVLSTANASANGRVYEYRAPVAGARQGRYQPLRVLPTPLEKQVVSAGVNVRVDSTASVFVDVASSQLDRNRFSPQADKGQAMRVGYVVKDRPMNLPGLRDYKLRTALDYEYTSHRFSPIDRYRDIEFDRNWSTGSTVQSNSSGSTAREDNILNLAVGAVKDAGNNFGYRLSRRYRAGEVNGVQHWLDAAQRLGDVQLNGSLFLLSSDVGRRRSTWARGETAVRYTRGRLVPGYAYRFDKNRVALPSGDSITSANYFDEHAVFVQSQDTARTKFRLDYTYRRDQTPNAEQTALRERGRAQTWQGQLSSRLGRSQDINLLATYRDLSARDSARQSTVLGQVGWNASLLRNQIRSELNYSVATGRELRRDYTFLAVPNGQGTHYYAGDLNRNGREDKEEFFEAQTVDAVYRTHIKVFVPTDDYVTAFTNRFGYRLTVGAPRNWHDLGGWQAAAARFSTLTTVTLDRRTTEKSLSARLNPFAYQTDDDKLLSLSKLLRNTLYFNRSNPIFGGELTIQQSQQKSLLSTGTDTRNLASQSVLLRRNLAQSFTGRLTGTRSIRENQSTYLLTRNFRLQIHEVQPELSYQPSSTWRFTGTYSHATKLNTLDTDADNTRGVFDELGLETRISQVSKRTFSAATHFTRVAFRGDRASVVGIEVLNALQPGNNLTWSLNLEQRLSNGLNITLSYDGRKPSGLKVIHTGRMQAAVLF